MIASAAASASSNMDAFCGSEFWNTTLTWNSDQPDFTPCFEQTVLVWTPCIFLWMFTPFELYFIRRSERRGVPASRLHKSKVVLSIILIILSACDLCVSIRRKVLGEYVYGAYYFSPSFKISTFILSITLLVFNRRAGFLSSGLLTLFWFFMLLFGIPQYRSEIIYYSKQTLSTDELVHFFSYMFFVPVVALNFLLFSLSESNFTGSGYDPLHKQCPEKSSSFLSQLTFTWFDSLIWRGYRKPLEPDDLWDINAGETCGRANAAFDVHFQRSLQNAKRKSDEQGQQHQASILPALLRSFGAVFLFAAVMEILGDIFIFANPHILKLLIAHTGSHEPLWKGLVYAFAMVAADLTHILFHSQSQYFMKLVGMRMRAALVSAVYRKSLKISPATLGESSTGQVVNLMANDAQILLYMDYITVLWSAPLKICVCVYLLYSTLGVAIFGGMLVMVLLIPLNFIISRKLETYQTKQLETKDERVKVMNEILNGMKVLKLYAWEKPFSKKVEGIRSKEMKFLRKELFLAACTSFVFEVAPVLVTLVSFAVYVLIDKNNVLDAQKAFFTLSLFDILEGPLQGLPSVVIGVVQDWVSIKRLSKFLNSPDMDTENVSHNVEEAPALLIEEGTFSWGPDEDPVLRDINLTVESGQLVAVVGRVGSGKSSLLAAMLGETEKKSGRVNTKGSMAYVPQQAWIQNASLRDNILFGRELDPVRYARVLDACALREDLAVLPAGDATEIGEKGINLSGGQKQRVSLARALYRDADVLLLDDPLSAVDSHVGKHIFDNVVGPNSELKDKVDLIVVLKGGEVSDSGSYQELVERGGAFAELLGALQDKQDKAEDAGSSRSEPGSNSEADVEVENKRDGTVARKFSLSSSSESNASDGEPRRRRRKRHSSSDEENDVEKLITEEEAYTGRVKASVYAHYVRSAGVKVIAFAVVLGIILEGFSAGSSVWLARWTDDPDMSHPNSSNFIYKRNMYLGVYAAFELSQVFLDMTVSFTMSVACLRASKVLHSQMFSRILRCPMSFFDTTPVGRILNRFSKDVNAVDNILPYYLFYSATMIFSVLETLGVISYSVPMIIAALIPLGLLYYLLQRFYVEASRQLKRMEGISSSPVYSHFSETLSGMSSIRAYGETDRFIREVEQIADANQKCFHPMVVARRWVSLRLDVLSTSVVFLSALFAVLGRDKISSAFVGLSVSYAMKITQTLSYLVDYSVSVETNIVAVERIKEYCEVPQEAEWLSNNEPVDDSWPDRGAICFDNFSLRYRDGLDLVLKEVDLSINPGEKIGIVGRTGAGKSSLTLAVFRILEAAGGKILVDNTNIADLGLQTLRSKLTIIPQDPVLFSGPLRDNLDPYGDKSDEELWRALESAHLKHHVQGFDDTLNHQINEGGSNMSVGQRQLVCLARALLRKTKILVFDEATAAVDIETESLILQTIKSDFKDCTVLTIAHRLHTIIDSDRVLVMQEGKVQEFDPPQVLLQNKNSIFYGLAKDAGIV